MLLLQRPQVIELKQGREYSVLSSKNDHYYFTTIHGKQYCECMDFLINYSRNKNYLCKHIRQAQDFCIINHINKVNKYNKNNEGNE